ncbi:hypothetical protein FRC09_001484 [Ceratobasidium sp. 395]|nr:hypothetical protein FRC09_001484 [Ceratobasidium sp. 395]
MEVAVLITDGNLQLVDKEGCHFVVKSNERTFEEMDDWCKVQHKKSGLIDKADESMFAAPEVADAVLNYIKSWVPKERTALLAGSSVHFDAMFLRATGPDVAEHGGQPIWKKIADHLHYRIVDVSSVKVSILGQFTIALTDDVFTTYRNSVNAGTLKSTRSTGRHAPLRLVIGTAMDDISASIAELKFYREAIFVSPKPRVDPGIKEGKTY